jgi:hypothetical protein
MIPRRVHPVLPVQPVLPAMLVLASRLALERKHTDSLSELELVQWMMITTHSWVVPPPAFVLALVLVLVRALVQEQELQLIPCC